MPSPIHTPDWLREQRDQLGLTQRQFGDVMGVDTHTVSRWECGGDPPRSWRMLALAIEGYRAARDTAPDQ